MVTETQRHLQPEETLTLSRYSRFIGRDIGTGIDMGISIKRSTGVRIRIHICICICLCICIRECAYVCLRICIFVYMYICIYVYMYICANVCRYVCICMDINIFIDLCYPPNPRSSYLSHASQCFHVFWTPSVFKCALDHQLTAATTTAIRTSANHQKGRYR